MPGAGEWQVPLQPGCCRATPLLPQSGCCCPSPPLSVREVPHVGVVGSCNRKGLADKLKYKTLYDLKWLLAGIGYYFRGWWVVLGFVWWVFLNWNRNMLQDVNQRCLKICLQPLHAQECITFRVPFFLALLLLGGRPCVTWLNIN